MSEKQIDRIRPITFIVHVKNTQIAKEKTMFATIKKVIF